MGEEGSKGHKYLCIPVEIYNQNIRKPEDLDHILLTSPWILIIELGSKSMGSTYTQSYFKKILYKTASYKWKDLKTFFGTSLIVPFILRGKMFPFFFFCFLLSI